MTGLSQCTKEGATDELRFWYDGYNLIATLNSEHSTLNSFAWGLDLSGSMQGAGGIGGLLWMNNGLVSTHFVSYDGNGNVTALVNAADGSESARYEYGPFGEVIRASGPAAGSMVSANPFRFSTKYQDDESDLLYYGYRYYNASTGRWLSRDPVEEKGGLDLYAFVQNDPCDAIDAYGLQSTKPAGPPAPGSKPASNQYSCDPETEKAFRTLIDDFCSIIGNSETCPNACLNKAIGNKSANSGMRKLLQACKNRKKLNIRCDPNGETPTCEAGVVAYGDQSADTITLCSPYLNKSDPQYTQKCVAYHEFAHWGWRPNQMDNASELDKCLGCPGRKHPKTAK